MSTRTRNWILVWALSLFALIAWYVHFVQSTETVDIEPLRPSFTPHDELYSVHMSPSGMGWTAGKFGRILHTPDGGKHWTEQQSGTTEPLTAVSFSSDLSGIAVGGAGTILTTTDGGQSWIARNAPAREHLLDAQAVSPRSAVVAGAFGTFLSTHDGGVTWLKHNLEWGQITPRLLAEKGSVEPNLNAVYFVDDQEGWAGGEFRPVVSKHDSPAPLTIECCKRGHAGCC